MKILLFFLFGFFFSIPSFSQVSFQSLTTIPLFPQAGKELIFTYNPAGIGLENAPTIDCIVYFKDEKEIKAEDVILTKEKALYKGKISIPRNAKAILLSFQDRYIGKAEELAIEGFPLKIYSKNQQVIEEGYSALAELYSDWTRLNEQGKNNDLIVSWFEEEFKKYPQSKRKYLDAYLGTLKNIGLEKNKSLIRKELSAFEQLENLDESELGLLHSWYEILNDGQKKTQYATLLASKYPKGKYITSKRYFEFIQETDNQKKKRLYEDFKKDFPQSENLLSIQLNLAYSTAKEGNWAEFENITHQLKVKDKASLFNSIALECVESETNLGKAKELAAQITEYAKNLSNQSSEKKPLYLSDNQWKGQLKIFYATYADTYGQVLSKLGNDDAALPYLKEASEIFVDNTEVNEHYAIVLAKSSTSLSMKKTILEKLIREGQASSKVKEILRGVYEQEKNKLNFEDYLADLEKPLKERMKERLNKKWVNEPIPNLDWTDLQGKKVNLSDFKGKIVVITFWATWCETCIASFPMLQKLITQYSKEEVVFLFVNTWESTDNKQKTAIDFLKENKYPFQVLIDKNDSVIEDFKVNNIFSKIIIDKSGAIRFKNTNLSDDNDVLGSELRLMLEIVSSQK